MRGAAIIGGLFGLALLTALILHSDMPVVLTAARKAGPGLLWIVPYRLVFFALYAIGWRALLQPFDADRRASFGYVLWATSVREAIDRLLPVASLGGGIVGVRLMTWRGIAAVPAGATVIVEILLTLFAVCLFGCLATAMRFTSGPAIFDRRLIPVLIIGVAIPACSLLLLRSGSVFRRMHIFLSPIVGLSAFEEAEALDAQLRLTLDRARALLMAGTLQLVALISASFEIWWALSLFGHTVSASQAIILEGFTQAMRHLAFVVPAGLGVQEAALVFFGHAFGISSEVALAVSAAKRMREILCGLPPLLSWQWLESRRLRPSVVR